jgi:hypothetical protein
MNPLPLQQKNSGIREGRLNTSKKEHTFKNWFISANKSILNDKYYLFLIIQTFVDKTEDCYQLKP